MAVEVRVPEAGESIREVQIGPWRKAEGDAVVQDEILLEVETDKAAMEIPAPASGTLSKLIHKQGDFVPVGQVIAVIEEASPGAAPAVSDGHSAAQAVGGPKRAAHAAERAAHEVSGLHPARTEEAKPPAGKHSAKTAAPADAPAAPKATPRKPPAGSAAPATPAAAAPAKAGPSQSISHSDGTRVMPAAQRLLDEHGLNAVDIQGTGPGGRILKEDVQRYLDAVAKKKSPPIREPVLPAAPDTDVPTLAGDRQEEAVPMTMLRRRVAERLVQAQQTAAMLTTFNEVDMSGVMALRKQHQEPFQQKYGIKLGFMSFFVKAAVDALKAIPQLNAEIREQNIIYRNYYDIGVAVSSEKGLVVPVLRNAERLSFAQVELTLADLADRARQNKLSLQELEGGTFTITNGGVFGSMLSTPILNPPQSGILGLHAIQDRPVVRDGQIVIRPIMYVALTYDHRIVDGKEAVTFLRRIKECVENPTRMLIEV